jgi:hypothetical protein
MALVFEAIKIDRTLGPARRTALGLGPIETDPRDTAILVQVREEDATGVTVIAEFEYPYARGPMTPAALVPLLRAQARALADGDLNGRGENLLIGRPFAV